MLDHFTDRSRAQRRRRLGPAASLSIAAHICAAAGLLAAASWKVEKLAVADTPILLAAAIDPLPSMGQEPPPVPKPRRPPRKRVVTDITQASRKEEEPPDVVGPKTTGGPLVPGPIGGCPTGMDCTGAATPPPAPPTPVCGNGRLEQGEQCDDGGLAPGDGCSPACRTERALVSARAIEAHRISGDPQIAAPDSVRSQMVRKGESTVSGTVKMCLDAEGAVRSLAVVASTGYPEYDQRLTSRMEGWRYRAYEVGGKRVPVCTFVRFIYRMR